MDKSKLISKFNSKLREIKKHNRLYFKEDNPVLTDAEYDRKKREILDLESKFPFLKKYGSIENLIGTPPSNKFKKVKHLHPMLSLANAFDKNDMLDFFVIKL